MSYQPLATSSSEMNLSKTSTLKTKARSLGMENEAELEKDIDEYSF